MEPPVAVADVSGRQGRDLGARAKPRRHPRRSREDARHPRGERHRQRHVAGRRLRPQVEMRLRAGGGIALEGGRRAGQGAVDAGGRCPPRLPSHRFGGADRSRPRQERQGDRVAAPQRGADHLSTFVANAVHEAPFELGMGLVDHAVRDRQHSLRESGSCRPYPHRLVPFGVEHSARLRGAVDGRGNRARHRTRSQRTCCWN